MYETPEQKEPVYEAKGIETVRRDGCPAVAKVDEKKLKFFILINNFDCRSLRKPSNYFSKLWTLVSLKNIFVVNLAKFCPGELISKT